MQQHNAIQNFSSPVIGAAAAKGRFVRNLPVDLLS